MKAERSTHRAVRSFVRSFLRLFVCLFDFASRLFSGGTGCRSRRAAALPLAAAGQHSCGVEPLPFTAVGLVKVGSPSRNPDMAGKSLK